MRKVAPLLAGLMVVAAVQSFAAPDLKVMAADKAYWEGDCPDKSRLTVACTGQPVVSETEALLIAVEEKPGDVVAVLERGRFGQNALDVALDKACSSASSSSNRRNPDNPETVRALLSKGANPGAVVHQASQEAPRCLKLLVEGGADVNTDLASLPTLIHPSGSGAYRARGEGTPLFFAVRMRNLETAKILLEAGADPNKTFGSGKSAYSESLRLFGKPDPQTQAIRDLMEAKGASLTLAQKQSRAAEKASNAAKGAAYVAGCLLAAFFGGCH
jgi:hypothetical protein